MRLIDTDKLKFPNIAVFDIKLHGAMVPMVRVLDLKELMPAVDAVPLDKLCALLAKNTDCPPEHSPVQDHCIQTKCAECWKLVLKEWMEEQNA